MADSTKASKVIDSCPHCGHKLNPWQQVLLKVDKTLVCKNCWYRIITESTEDETPPKKTDTENSQSKD